MEAVFDNKNNVLNAQICATHDNSIIYSLKSTFGWGGTGKKLTILRDTNPGPGSTSTVAGAIHWPEKIMEVDGRKKKISEIKRREGGLLNKY